MDLIIRGTPTPRQEGRGGSQQGKLASPKNLSSATNKQRDPGNFSSPNYSTPDAPRKGPKPVVHRTFPSSNNSNNKVSSLASICTVVSFFRSLTNLELIG